MVLDEFLPLLADQGLATARVGLMGWSMGGYAALRLGAVLGPEGCAVVVADEPGAVDRRLGRVDDPGSATPRSTPSSVSSATRTSSAGHPGQDRLRHR